MSGVEHTGPIGDEQRDELAAYTLGALADDERLALEAHLSRCDQCHAYLRWLDPAVDLLPIAVAQERAPARMRRELMRTVRAEARADARAQRAREGGRSGMLGLIWRPATGIAVATVLIVGALGGYALRGDDPAPPTTFTEAEPVIKGGGSYVATLERTGNRGTLHVEEMPPLPRDRVYQLWIDRDREFTPSTPFVIRRDGTNEVAVDGSLAGADAIHVTREPSGGSEKPTSTIVLSAPAS